MTTSSWARLRQVCFATLDHEAGVQQATKLLDLGPGFADPLLADWNLADFTAPVGPDTYVEVLAPTLADHPVARWLHRAGGSAGWVLSTQVPSLSGVRERAAQHGVRIAVETTALGRNIVQLHPKDAGIMLELDELLPRDAWFWDDMAAAQAAHAGRTAKVDDIVAVEIAAADPAPLASVWAAIIGIDPPVPAGEGADLKFGSRTIRFRPALDGRTGIVAVDVHAVDRDNVAGQAGELCHTLIRFV